MELADVREIIMRRVAFHEDALSVAVDPFDRLIEIVKIGALNDAIIDIYETILAQHAKEAQRVLA